MATIYTCPGCGGALRFDAVSGKMICGYCDSVYTVEELKASDKSVLTGEQAAMFENEQGDYVEINDSTAPEDQMAIYSFLCPSCGAELMGDANTAATFCAFCGNPTLNEAVLTKELKPKKVLPFKTTKADARKAFLAWGRKGFLTPKDFTSASTIKKITGIYVPFWLYDVEAVCDYQGTAKKEHEENRRSHRYQVTDHFRISRKVDVCYSHIPADASKKMDDSLMDRLEPFDYNKLVDFDMAYLSGFLAEKYTYSDRDMRPRIQKRVVEYVEQTADESVLPGEYNGGHEKTGSRTRVIWRKAEYVMLPVWILNYRYKGEMYEFAMNGQTGSVVGKKPVDSFRKWILTILIFIIGTVAIFLLLLVLLIIL